MAYMSQEKKASIVAQLKRVVPKSWKYSVGVEHHSTLRLTITAAPHDVLGFVRTKVEFPVKDHYELNEYWWRETFGDAPSGLLDVLTAIFAAVNDGNHNRSDMQTDYHDVGWYVSVSFGRWNRPFANTAAIAKPHARFVDGQWQQVSA